MVNELFCVCIFSCSILFFSLLSLYFCCFLLAKSLKIKIILQNCMLLIVSITSFLLNIDIIIEGVQGGVFLRFTSLFSLFYRPLSPFVSSASSPSVPHLPAHFLPSPSHFPHLFLPPSAPPAHHNNSILITLIGPNQSLDQQFGPHTSWSYRNDPKFSDRYAWTNSADPDQTVPRGAVWSGSTLFGIPTPSFGLITLW